MSIPKRLILTVRKRLVAATPSSETTSSSSISGLAASARDIGHVDEERDPSPPPPIVIVKSGSRPTHSYNQQTTAAVVHHGERSCRPRSPERGPIGGDRRQHPSRSASADFRRLEELRGDGDACYGYYYSGDDSGDSGLSSDNSGFSRTFDRTPCGPVGPSVGRPHRSPSDAYMSEQGWTENSDLMHSWLRSNLISCNINQTNDHQIDSEQLYLNIKNQRSSLQERSLQSSNDTAVRDAGQYYMSNASTGARHVMPRCESSQRNCVEYYTMARGANSGRTLGETMEGLRRDTSDRSELRDYREIPRGGRTRSKDRSSVPHFQAQSGGEGKQLTCFGMNKMENISLEHPPQYRTIEPADGKRC